MSALHRLTVAVAVVAVTVGTAVAGPPAAADNGNSPVVLDLHDSDIPPATAVESSSSAGTIVWRGDYQLIPAPLTLGSQSWVDLGVPGSEPEASIAGDEVAAASVDASVAEPWSAPYDHVWSCQVSACDSGWPVEGGTPIDTGVERYLGNTPSGWLFYRFATENAPNGTFFLRPYAGGSDVDLAHPRYPITVVPDEEYAFKSVRVTADADAAAFVLFGDAYYLPLDGSALTLTDWPNQDAGTGWGPLSYAENAVLTPQFVLWYAWGNDELEHVWRVARATIAAFVSDPLTVYNPEQVLQSPFDFNAFAATDTGLAWVAAEGLEMQRLFSKRYGGPTVQYQRTLSMGAVVVREGSSQFLLVDRESALPGFYSINSGAVTGSLVGLLGIRSAFVQGLALYDNRALFSDDSVASHPVFVSDTGDLSDLAEVQLAPQSSSGAIGTSGPFFAYVRGAFPSMEVAYGRFAAGEQGATAMPNMYVDRIRVSGHRALVEGTEQVSETTSYLTTKMLDLLTGNVTTLTSTTGHRVFAALWGDYIAQVDTVNGAVQRRVLGGATTTVLAGLSGCTAAAPCVDTDEFRGIEIWGNRIAYAFPRNDGWKMAIWTDGVTTAFPGGPGGGDTGWYPYHIALSDHALLVMRSGSTTWLHDLDNPSADAEIGSHIESPGAVDGDRVAYRNVDDMLVRVAPVSHFLSGYAVTAPRLLGQSVPAAFKAEDGWGPEFYATRNVTWTMAIHSGSPAGPTVRTLSGSSADSFGAIQPGWDGTDDSATALPNGTYYWELTGSDGGQALDDMTGSENLPAASGSVYLSATKLAAPRVNVPVRSTDATATLGFPVSWGPPSGSYPAGSKYVVKYTVNTGTTATTWKNLVAATSAPFTGAQGSTYHFRAYVADPAGRLSNGSSADDTVVPWDDGNSDMSYSSGDWGTVSSSTRFLGGQHYASAAGSTLTFTARGTTIALIGDKGPGLGQFKVQVDGGSWTTTGSWASTTQPRKVLWSRAGLEPGLHTVKVYVLGTPASRPKVMVDAIAFTR